MLFWLSWYFNYNSNSASWVTPARHGSWSVQDRRGRQGGTQMGRAPGNPQPTPSSLPVRFLWRERGRSGQKWVWLEERVGSIPPPTWILYFYSYSSIILWCSFFRKPPLILRGVRRDVKPRSSRDVSKLTVACSGCGPPAMGHGVLSTCVQRVCGAGSGGWSSHLSGPVQASPLEGHRPGLTAAAVLEGHPLLLRAEARRRKSSGLCLLTRFWSAEALS